MTSIEPLLVSVIIPCYNQAQYLGETIESVVRQTYPHFEIIVVDDGSTDNTSEVAARYEAVRYVRQENQGRPAVPRNRGLSESKGAYLVFLDADDRLLPHALETGVHYLDAHPECAFVSGHCQVITTDGTPLPTAQRPCVEKDHYLALLQDNYIWMPAAVMFRRDAVESMMGFDTCMSKKGSEDYDLYLRIAAKSPVYCHDQVIAEYRKHEQSVSSNPEWMLKATLKVLRGQQDRVKGDKRYEEAYNSGIRFWKEYYGEGIVEKVRAGVRESDGWKKAFQGILVLLRYCPHVFARHTTRKLYSTVFRVKN
jgi:glycosyltransferase involved in cell wall biosynthesis